MSRVETIGDCVLHLGDCLEILPTLPRVDFCITDPPYGHNNNNGDLIHNREAALGKGPRGDARAIANDGPEANDLYRNSLPLIKELLGPGCCYCCCCCGGGGPDPQFARWSIWLDEVFNFKQMVVWDKGPMGMGWHYRRSYEVVLVGEKPGGACAWYDKTSAVENIIRPGQHGIKKIIPSSLDHPTPKPPQLAAHFVRLHTRAGDTVLDPFMGAGWVAVACVELGRKFIGIEIDEKYFDIACRRIEQAVKKQACKLPGFSAPKPQQQSILESQP